MLAAFTRLVADEAALTVHMLLELWDRLSCVWGVAEVPGHLGGLAVARAHYRFRGIFLPLGYDARTDLETVDVVVDQGGQFLALGSLVVVVGHHISPCTIS
jgi:hypothetical protein